MLCRPWPGCRAVPRRSRRGPVRREPPQGAPGPPAGSCPALCTAEAAARELPPVVNLPPANPFWTASAVQKGTVSIFCQLQLT